MIKHIMIAIFVGGVFAIVIAAIAGIRCLRCRRAVLLASLVAGLAAGLCIGGLIAANFVMLAQEEKEREKPSRTLKASPAPRRKRLREHSPASNTRFQYAAPASRPGKFI